MCSTLIVLGTYVCCSKRYLIHTSSISKKKRKEKKEIPNISSTFILQLKSCDNYIVSPIGVSVGKSHSKPYEVLIDVLLSGPDNLDNLRRIAEQFQKQAPAAGATEDDDNDVPELVAGETFEAAANEGQTQIFLGCLSFFLPFTILVFSYVSLVSIILAHSNFSYFLLHSMLYFVFIPIGSFSLMYVYCASNLLSP